MGHALALKAIRKRQRQAAKREPLTMHDKNYRRVIQAVAMARRGMQPGQIRQDIICPICGGPAWVLPRTENDGKTIIAMCERECWICRE